MSASNLPRMIAARVCGYMVLTAAIVLSGTCGSNPAPTPVSTTVPTTTIASTTTTTTPVTTTTIGSTSTTTTSIAPLDAFISVQNTPCVAPSAGDVSCTFAGSATGGRPPYTFRWTFTNPANNQVVNDDRQNARPSLGCGFSTGVVTFNLRAVLTVTDNSGAKETEDRNQQVARAAGACGT